MKGVLAATRDLAVNRVAQPVLAFVLVVAAGRTGSELLGAYTVVTVWFILLQTLPMLGLGPLLARELATKPDQAGVILGSTVALGMAAATLLGLGADLVLPAAGYAPEVRDAVLLSALSALPSVVVFVAETWLIANHDTGPVGVVSLGENLLRLVASLAALALGYGVAALFLVVLAGRLAAAAYYVGRLRSVSGGLAVSRSQVATLLRACPVYLVHTLVFLVVGRADFVALSLVIPESGVAPYAVAYKFLEVGLLLVVAFSGAVFPHLARASEGGEATTRFARLAVHSTKLLLAAAAPLWALLHLNADGLVRLFFPNQCEAALPLLRYLLPALGFASFRTLSSTILLSEGRPGAELATMAVGAATYLVFLAVLVPLHGATGAAVATLVEAVVQVAARAVVLARHFSLEALRAERVAELGLAVLALAAGVIVADLTLPHAYARAAASGVLALAFGAGVAWLGLVRVDHAGSGTAARQVPR